MNLARQQTALLSLLKSGHFSDGEADPYIDLVAGSEHLVMLRQVILAWRFYDVQLHCPLTAALLKKRGTFEETVKAFAATPNLSAFPDQLAEAFLRRMSIQRDPFVAAVAKFELYMTKVKLGDGGEYTIDWPADPRVILRGLTQQTKLTASKSYRMRISRRYPGLAQVTAA